MMRDGCWQPVQESICVYAEFHATKVGNSFESAMRWR